MVTGFESVDSFRESGGAAFLVVVRLGFFPPSWYLVGIVSETLAPISCSVVGSVVKRAAESAPSRSSLLRFRTILFDAVAACILAIGQATVSWTLHVFKYRMD